MAPGYPADRRLRNGLLRDVAMTELGRQAQRVIDDFVGLAALCDPATRSVLAKHLTDAVFEQLGPDIDRAAAAESLRKLIAAGVDRFNVAMTHASHPQWGTA
jgi:hypothetical protein